MLTAIAALSVGVVGALLLLPRAAPPTLGVQERAQSAPVEETTFFDERAVTLNIVSNAGQSFLSPRDGVLTSFHCAPGSEWKSPKVVATVNGDPLIALHLSSPPWRDFVNGISGPDVRALQRELKRLGYEPATDGRYGESTARAVRDLFNDLSVNLDRDELKLTDLVWLSEGTAQVATCTAPSGQRLTDGAELAVGNAILTGVTLADVPGNLLPGDRVLVVDGLEVPLGESLAVSDAISLSALSESAQIGAHQQNHDLPVVGTLRLAEQQSVLRVPAGAVVGAGSGEVCLLSGGVSIPVEVVASSLGTTLVALVNADTDSPMRVDLPESAGSLQCW